MMSAGAAQTAGQLGEAQKTVETGESIRRPGSTHMNVGVNEIGLWRP
jgi:hypothetical protein